MRLLVVEDERKMADLLEPGVEEENHRVTVAQDERVALELEYLPKAQTIDGWSAVILA